MLKTTSICFAKIISCRSGRRWLRELVSSCSRGRKSGVFERHIVCSHKAAGEGGGDNGGVKKRVSLPTRKPGAANIKYGDDGDGGGQHCPATQ